MALGKLLRVLLVVSFRVVLLRPLSGLLQQCFPHTGDTEIQLTSPLAYGVVMKTGTKSSLTLVRMDFPYGRTYSFG
jgi:hypothetical protein